MESISQIRKLSGLTQVKFAEKYHIPINTLKGWESNIESKRYRKCPEYILYLLEIAVKNDLKQTKP